jgi:hypothetical protein
MPNKSNAVLLDVRAKLQVAIDSGDHLSPDRVAEIISDMDKGLTDSSTLPENRGALDSEAGPAAVPATAGAEAQERLKSGNNVA